MGTSSELPVLLLGTIAAGAITGLVGLNSHHARHPADGHHRAPQIVLTMVVVALLGWRVGAQADLLIDGSFAATAIPLAWNDARTSKLPNRGLALMYIVVGATIILTGLVAGVALPLLRAVVGAVVCLVFFGTLYVLPPGGLGGGDVKLVAPLGAVLAWTSWSMLFSALLVGWVAAALAHLIGRLRGHDSKMLPLGPFLIGAAILSLLILPT